MFATWEPTKPTVMSMKGALYGSIPQLTCFISLTRRAGICCNFCLCNIPDERLGRYLGGGISKTPSYHENGCVFTVQTCANYFGRKGRVMPSLIE